MQRLLIIVLAAAFVAASTVRAAADDFSTTGVALLERWNTAIWNHAPGARDGSVALVLSFTYEDRRLLDAPMRTFLTILSGRRYVPNGPLQEKVQQLAFASQARFGYQAFLERAVLLHTDAAITTELGPPPVGSVLPAGPASQSPLLATRRMTVSRDGEILGHLESDWNWPFARSLVGSIHAAAPADRFAGDWYHATTAFMYERRLYAEASAHLPVAAKILPEDPRILFDRAIYWEIQGMPMNQSLWRGVDMLALRRWRESGRLPPNTNAATRAFIGLDIPLKDDADAQAERLFRRALSVDPAHVEARVRLARVLLERKRYEDALAEVRTALSATTSEVVAFYGRLFGGRAAQALGRLDEAAQHFEAASRLFPEAESALLASSQLALLRADVNGAIAPIDRLPRDPHPNQPIADPWEYYRMATGRDWETLYRAVRSR
jgi:tetratricopeptide (TPR) repeat protein